MKKTLPFLMSFCLIGNTFAQDGNDKNFRFGLKVTPSINWLKIDDKNTYEGGGAVMKFGYGLMTEFHLAQAAWLSTGFQLDYEGGKINTTMTSIIDNTTGKMAYAYNANKGFLEVDDYASNTDTNYNSYLLQNRKYNSIYLTLPFHLRLKTKEIGYLTYYGNIGLNTSIQLKTRVNDEALLGSTAYTQSFTVEDLDNSKDMNFLKMGLVVGGGTEWNISGSTSLLFGIHFYQGFMNYVKKESKYLLDIEKSADATLQNGTSTYVAQTQKFLNNNITLTVGVLF